LSADLLAFLREGRELEYDVVASEVGTLTHKEESELSRSTITTFPGCDSIIEGPYEDLEDGEYQIAVYDLVAETEGHDPEGMQCWIITLKCFGSIDPEHGEILSFPKVIWTAIVKSPIRYLAAQWQDGSGAARVLPWL
jgi:hypothetical protein